MQQAMHAARLVAAHSAALALLHEAKDEHPNADGITLRLTSDEDCAPALDVIYTFGDLPIAGEGC